MASFAGKLPFTLGNPAIWLREVCGHDELAVTDVGTLGAIDLIDKLLIPAPGSAAPLPAAHITTADRDRLLVSIYRDLYGNGIDSTIDCAFCGEPFDVNFLLDDLLAFTQPVPDETVTTTPDGLFQHSDGTGFRLPTGTDELAVVGLPAAEAAEQLLQRCLTVSTDPADKGDQVQAAMQAMAPLLDMDLGARCPECGQAQSVQFSMQSFLLNRMKNEQKQVAAEVHQLASAYRWSHAELVGLPRRLRRMYLGFIQSERSSADRWLS